MSHSLVGRPRGRLPWPVEVALVLLGVEAAGDLVELLTDGAGAAARDAAWDTGAVAACELATPLALVLGLHDLPIDGCSSGLIALMARAWAAPLRTLVAFVVDALMLYLNGVLLATTNAAQANSANSSVQYSPTMNRSKRLVAAGSVLRRRRYCMRWWMLPCSQLCSDSTTPSTA
jgi:hypothetical protein